jgi:asparagine synthase (glutamine-hydrolysing)
MTKNEWELFIDDLHKNETSFDLNRDEIVIELASLIENTILEMAKPIKGKIGVLFSGGVDSTLICYILQKHKIPFLAATIGFQDLKNPDITYIENKITGKFNNKIFRCQKLCEKGRGVKYKKMPRVIFRHNDEQKLPDDILESRIIAKKYGFNHVEKLYSFDEVSDLFLETVKILGSDLTNAVNIGVGSVEVAGVKLLQEHDSKIKFIFGGLGSEEIFAGYKRHADSLDKHNECWTGLKNMYERDLTRDFAIADNFKISFLTPFLNKEIISFSMGIPIDFKINEGSNKIILRESAFHLGLEKVYAFRPKKAAQYGSRTDKAISKLAKKAGFSLKKEYLDFLITSIKE